MDPKTLLLAPWLSLSRSTRSFWFVTGHAAAAAAAQDSRAAGAAALTLVIGFITNFFDTLGIGSYATTTIDVPALERSSATNRSPAR